MISNYFIYNVYFLTLYVNFVFDYLTEYLINILIIVDVVFFKHKPAYEMRISDWSSDVCSSDLAVADIAARHDVVLITKGDLFHQEAKWRDSGMADLFRRIEIVSEKDPATYARLLEEFDIEAAQFLMIGNSLRSDIAPVLSLGGWGVHMPYHTTWSHENEASVDAGSERMRSVGSPGELPAAVEAIAAAAAA